MNYSPWGKIKRGGKAPFFLTSHSWTFLTYKSEKTDQKAGTHAANRNCNPFCCIFLGFQKSILQSWASSGGSRAGGTGSLYFSIKCFSACNSFYKTQAIQLLFLQRGLQQPCQPSFSPEMKWALALRCMVGPFSLLLPPVFLSSQHVVWGEDGDGGERKGFVGNLISFAVLHCPLVLQS